MFSSRRISAFLAASLALTLSQSAKAQDVSSLIGDIAKAFHGKQLAACLVEYDKQYPEPNKYVLDTNEDETMKEYEAKQTFVVVSGMRCSRTTSYSNAEDKEPYKSCEFSSAGTSLTAALGPKAEDIQGVLTYATGVLRHDAEQEEYAFHTEEANGAGAAYIFRRDNLKTRIPLMIQHDQNGALTEESFNNDWQNAAFLKPVPESLPIPTVPEFDSLLQVVKGGLSVCSGPST